MSEPTRKIYDDPEFAKLFEASELDGPSYATMERALARATHVATTSRFVSWGSWKSGVAIGIAIAGAGLVGAFSKAESRNATAVDTAISAPIPASAVNAPAEAESSTRTVRTVSVDELEAAPLAASARSAPAPSRAGALPNTSSAANTTFDEELALVASARSSLESKDIRACLGAVDHYERRFLAGRFAQEIEVIHIEALSLSGERSRARARAERFLEIHTTSPYTKRVRSALERIED